MHSSEQGRPASGEYAEYYDGYISLVEGSEVIKQLSLQLPDTLAELKSVPENEANYRYAEGKWTIKEVVGHLIDTERVMAFRALSFARGDESEIAGMDQDQYVEQGAYADCDYRSLIEEFANLRMANIAFFRNLPAEAWSRGGRASENFVTVRALAYIIAGHELHHLKVLKEKYFDDISLSESIANA